MTESENFTITATTAEISRIMLPDEANLAGNVHGGSILKLIEETGLICAQRFIVQNKIGDSHVRPALARVDQMSFRAPMHIGECASSTANVVFTSSTSFEVHVNVWAEGATGGKRVTNSAQLWYVPVQLHVQTPLTTKVVGNVPVPKLILSPADEAAGLARYEAQKAARAGREVTLRDRITPDSLGANSAARCELSQLLLPSDCDQYGFLRGGVLMKLMDNCAGIASFRHCRTNVVTVSVEATDFRVPVNVGSLIRVVAFPTHSSSRSLEIEIVVSAENLFSGEKFECTSTAFFVFVALDKKGAVLSVPTLTPQTPGEIARFEEGRLRYELRKQRR